MTNANPIKTKDNGEYLDFVIPKEFKNEILYISTKTELVKEKWKLYLIHGLNLDGKPQDFDPTPDIERKALGKCKDIASLKLALFSNASRFNNGDESPKPSKVKYSIKFEAGDNIIDQEFSLTSTERNPFTFYTLVTLKIEE